MRTFFCLTVALILFFATQGFSQSNAQDVTSIDRVGTTAAQFLKIGAGARPIAMGGAYTALSNDILSTYWNPAGLSRIAGTGEATFNHSEWLAETNYDFAAFSINVGTVGSFGAQVISFGTPEQPVRTVRNPDGTGQFWDANSIALGVTYARNLTDRFSIGFTAKFVQESIFNVRALGAAFDLGVLYDTPLQNLTLGATITNFGTKMSLGGRDIFFNEDPLPEDGTVDQVPGEFRTDSFEMPLNLRFGLAWRVMSNETFKVVASADGTQPNDNNEFLNGGIEVGIRNTLFLRGGYKALFLENSEQGVTFGAGLKYDTVGLNLRIDFAWADYGRLDDVKFVTFSVRY
ncbi:MAG: PorV/PorQ family protein [bacterium]